jgi:hypothetical protein
MLKTDERSDVWGALRPPSANWFSPNRSCANLSQRLPYSSIWRTFCASSATLRLMCASVSTSTAIIAISRYVAGWLSIFERSSKWSAIPQETN